MEPGSFRCRAIALVAAYAVAMQAVLSVFVPLQLSALTDPLSILCTHDNRNTGGDPARHELPCAAVCAALGHGVAGPLPPAVPVAYATSRTVVARLTHRDWQPPHLLPRGPQSPRGPPLA